MTAHISQKFKKLDEISHVLLRPGRYIGSINPHTAISYAISEDKHKMEADELTWCPALLKIFDEIISNSVDYSKTDSGTHLDTIKVNVDKTTGSISVFDNGGIVVVKHPEHDQYIPEMIFELRAGSNFNDDEDSTLTGQNGEGAALTSIFSTSFTVDTADGKNKFLQTHTNNSRDKTTPVIKKSKEHYTKITFTPDFLKLNLENLTGDDFRKIEKRVYDVAGCNPQLKIYFNDKKIDIKNFEDYIKMYVDEYIYDQNDNWKVGISKSDGGFTHVSFVNSTETTIGGLHVSYIADQIIVKLREYIEKKHKIQIKPSEIKNHLNLFINCNIIKPRYSSQTKEDMITEIKNFGTSFEVTDKFIKNIIKSSIVQSILDWAEAKANANLLAEMRKLNKNTDKVDPSKIIKLNDALEKKDRSKCILFLTEGDSAAKAVSSAKDPQLHGIFPLKGKPVNVSTVKPKNLMDNEEFQNILTITGLKIGEKITDINQLRYGKICFLTDQDLDGLHINGLLINMIHTFWPELFELGVIHRFKTPLIKVTCGKDLIEFYEEQDFIKWKNKTTKKYTSKYFKGLGTSTASDFKTYLANFDKNLIKYEIDDVTDSDAIKLAFSKDNGKTGERKNWLNILGTDD